MNLVQIVDSAMAQAVRQSGHWIACRIGCTECCIGEFSITQADAERLRVGLATLDRELAAQIVDRARQAAEDGPCPALDPDSGACELYEYRPITCRTFGPAVHIDGGALAACELCYDGASDEDIAACAIDLDPRAFEEGDTTVGLALLGGRVP